MPLIQFTPAAVDLIASSDLSGGKLAKQFNRPAWSIRRLRGLIRAGWSCPLHLEHCTECGGILWSGPEPRTCHTHCEPARQERFNRELECRQRHSEVVDERKAKPHPTAETYDRAIDLIREGATIRTAAGAIGVSFQALTRELARRGLSVRALRPLVWAYGERVCPDCGQTFAVQSPRQKRCPDCADVYWARWRREYSRRGRVPTRG